MTRSLRVLLLEDSDEDAELVIQTLTEAGYSLDVECVDTRHAFVSKLEQHTWDIVIADYSLPQFTGIAALKLVRERDADLPFLLVSGTIGEDVAVAALKSGAHDYIMKSNLKRLAPAVERELREADARREHRRTEERLAHLAYHDVLTDLPNRMLFHDRLKHSVAIARRDRRPLTLLMLDLDGFKEINDTLGHHVGDQVLRQAADRLRNGLREADTIARLGGDEFALILPLTNVEGATHASRKLLRELGRVLPVDGRSLTLRASIGIASFPDHGTSAEMLLQRADTAMYQAKGEALGVAVYAPDRDQHTHRRLALGNELREALDNEQFFLEYQPILHLRTGAVVGVEALLRWNHPTYGRLLPGEFMDLAEQAGMLDALTFFVLNRALMDWSGREPTTIAVNLSPRSLSDPQLPRRIGDALRAHDAPPSMLALDITENMIMSDQTRVMASLARLHEMGVRLSVDDFGTGYSSLSYLRRLPVDELKIDRSFVADLALGDEAIVRSVVDLAHNFGLDVVAEGVESEATRDQLLEIGCDAAQGVVISRPLPAHELYPWMTRRTDV